MNNLLEFYEAFWNKQHYALYDMERIGFTLDLDEIEAIRDKTEITIAECEDPLTAWAGYELNWNSTKDLTELFYGYKNFPIPPYIGGKNSVRRNHDRKPSTSYASIDYIASDSSTSPDDREALRLFLTRRAAKKTQEFAISLSEKALHGVLHTQLAPETETGRLSSRNPNLQNIPSKNDTFGLRKAFVARNGFSLVVIDYSQLELYILAHFLETMFGDSSLTEAVTSSDIHQTVANETGLQRSDAKAVVYGINYGKTGAGLGAQLRNPDGTRIGKAAGQNILDTVLARYPAIPKFQEACVAEARKTGRITTLLGRHRDISFSEGYPGQAERKCPNTRIQGSAADVVTAAMLRCYYDKRLRACGARMLLQVHDELIFECPSEHATAVLSRATALMENPFKRLKLKVPLKCEGNIGNNWSEAK